MGKTAYFVLWILLLGSCTPKPDTEAAKQEIMAAEKSFEKMVAEKGMAEGFAFFAADSAVINRGNDSLIFGKEGIRNYYEKHAKPGVTLTWTPDLVEVSGCGTLGYTYGQYVYTLRDSSGKVTEHRGIFHTVWKKQDNVWRYVWD